MLGSEIVQTQATAKFSWALISKSDPSVSFHPQTKPMDLQLFSKTTWLVEYAAPVFTITQLALIVNKSDEP